jgi:hypothetical protein
MDRDLATAVAQLVAAITEQLRVVDDAADGGADGDAHREQADAKQDLGGEEHLLAPPTNLSAVASVDEFSPEPPPIGAMKAPLAQLRPSNEERDSAPALRHLKPVGVGCVPSDYAARHTLKNALGGVLNVAAIEQHRGVVPRVIVQSPVVVAVQDLVQVDVAPLVARDDPPTAEVVVSNHEVGSALHDGVSPLAHGDGISVSDGATVEHHLPAPTRWLMLYAGEPGVRDEAHGLSDHHATGQAHDERGTASNEQGVGLATAHAAASCLTGKSAVESATPSECASANRAG